MTLILDIASAVVAGIGIGVLLFVVGYGWRR